MKAEVGLLLRSDGSGKFTGGAEEGKGKGASCVLCGVLGPVLARPRMELQDRAAVSVSLTPLSGSGGGAKERFLERILSQTAQAIIITTLHPRTLIRITLQVLAEEGPILPAAINAMVLALLDAGIPLYTTCTGVACAIDSKGNLLMNPTSLQLEDSISWHTFSFDSISRKCISIQSNGSFSIQQFDECYDACLEESTLIYSIFRETLSKQIRQRFS